MSTETGQVLGRGVYTTTEVERLIGVSPSQTRSWLFPAPRGVVGHSRSVVGTPLWEPGYARTDGKPAINFMDLQQLRVVRLLRARHFSLQHIRRAIRIASKQWSTPHPLANKRLSVLGRSIFLQVSLEDGAVELVELSKNQRAWHEILKPFLTDLDFAEDGSPARWYPGKNVEGVGEDVIVSPAIRFGKPIARRSGIETWVLAQDAEANGSAERVAEWYGIDVRDVRASVQWEKHLECAKAA